MKKNEAKALRLKNSTNHELSTNEATIIDKIKPKTLAVIEKTLDTLSQQRGSIQEQRIM